MVKDIIFLYYYSAPSLPKECVLKVSSDIVHRNLFLHNCGNHLVHFEFPVFEEHSYNTICNRKAVRALIQNRPSINEKYIIFRTNNADDNKTNITGYYKLGRAYYQETNMFNNNGFVWGIESSEVHLLKRGTIELQKIGRGPRYSWSPKWEKQLNSLLDQIKALPDIHDKYQEETNRLVNLFKDKKKTDEWREKCKVCEAKNKCPIYRSYRIYNGKHETDMYDVMNTIYTTNIYSRNVLNNIPKEYLA